MLGGTAYPLDGGEPYEADVSAIPRPFSIPVGESWGIPLFALCDGLGANCEWDEAAGVAAASFRDTTLTFTLGSNTVQVDDLWNHDISEWPSAPVYRDGELWVYGDGLFRTVWSIGMRPVADRENPFIREDSSGVRTSWIVNP